MHVKLLQQSFATFLFCWFTLIVGLYKIIKKMCKNILFYTFDCISLWLNY